MQDNPSPRKPAAQVLVTARRASGTAGPDLGNRPLHIAMAFFCLMGAVVALTLGVKSYAHVSLSADTQAHGVAVWSQDFLDRSFSGHG
jgi:hypothetical protein